MTLPVEIRDAAGSLIAKRLGLRLSDAKQADLERALLEGIRSTPSRSAEGYLASLAALPDHSAEWARLISRLTVGETYFFRDRASFDALEQHVLPSLLEARRSLGLLRLRLWSAACATGEEAYSLAILLDRLLPDRSAWSVTLLATDVNPAALDTAARGRYREWSLRETPPPVRARYFRGDGSGAFDVDADVRRMVTFAPLNLAADGYPSVLTNTSGMDLILCRNVLMYLTGHTQRAIVARLQQALLADGWLMVSAAETSIELFQPLAAINFTGAVLYRKAPRAAAPEWPTETSAPDLSWPAQPWLPPEDIAPSHPTVAVETGPAPPSRQEPTGLDWARRLADQGLLDEARRVCEAALRSDRLDPEAYLLLAAICQERGEMPGAFDALRRALYLAPDAAAAHFLMGSLLLREGQRGRGRRCMETVVGLLASLPPGEPVPGAGGLTAGRILETARAHLESGG